MKDESSVLNLKRFEPRSNAAVQDETTIASVVLTAVRESDVNLVGPSTPDDVSPEVMLRLITYCYTKGMYASGEIERKLRKSLIQQDIPEAKAIQRFRRFNRMALQNALEKTLNLMHRAKASEETPEAARREAAEKLETAAIIDLSLEE